MTQTDEKVLPPPATVRSNIKSIADMERDFEEHRGFVDRVADLIGGFSGSMSFVLLHVMWFSLWFLINTGVISWVPKFDPYPFILLAMIVSVEGVLLSTFVLMKQNRMQQRSDTRDHVNLQIDLLAEKEITKSLQMLQAICQRLEIADSEFGAELKEMATTTSVDLLAETVQADLTGEAKGKKD